MKLLPKLKIFIEETIREFDRIDKERVKVLEKLSAYISSGTHAEKTIKLTFICTHNSRRSHISQIWAQTAAFYYGIANIETYSGGTEATAFNQNAVKAMQEAGFSISKSENLENPVYDVVFSDEVKPIKSFSKIFDEAGNPQRDFAAIMTCSHADENCPFIPGASFRVSITYEDPKIYDGTPNQESAYRDTCRLIAREMLYVFSKV